MRIAVVFFMHETVTFLKNDTTYDDFIYEGSPARGEALLSVDGFGYMGGFVRVAREHHNVELVGIESPLFPKTGTASGWITEDAYGRFSAKMIEELKAQGPFDGVYMVVHGAAAVRGVRDAEADLARRIREVVGPDAIIAGTFDPHGNEDDEFLKSANLAFCVKYYPHYDAQLQGERAARTMIRSIRGSYKPVSVTRKPPILTASVLQWTGKSPWMDLVQRALTWEAREPDVFVNFYYGFAFADLENVGMTFQVMTNGDPELANKVADDMANTAWRKREELVSGTQVYDIADGVKLAGEAIKAGKTPVTLADHSDRSGSATWLLDQVIKQDLSDTLIVTVADKKVIDTLRAKGVREGDDFDMDVGGLADESAGQPVRVKGKILHVTNGIGGLAARGQMWVSVKFGKNNVLVISPYLCQITEPEQVAPLQLNCDDFKAIAIKSRVHFRRGFDDNGYSPTIFLVEPPEPFLGTVKVDKLPYTHTRADKFFPFNKSVTYP
ncbi:M81 family metallopeptidase [Oleiharenicola lentus]|uniref:M81 family metallopeptidase n=1 Tax=Oleiharenicola lentus TaxID=2508720 RepID=UPI003F67E94C